MRALTAFDKGLSLWLQLTPNDRDNGGYYKHPYKQTYKHISRLYPTFTTGHLFGEVALNWFAAFNKFPSTHTSISTYIAVWIKGMEECMF